MTMDFYKIHSVRSDGDVSHARNIVGIFVANVLEEDHGNARIYKSDPSDWVRFS